MNRRTCLLLFCLISILFFLPGTAFSQDVNVNATVPANPSDFDAVLTQITSGNTYPQDEEIEYEITYGSNLNYPTSITVEASWSLGTIQGSGTPGDDTLIYVIGSASNGYASTPPVIDTVNRKIIWTIPTFPGNTTRTVSFTLQTTGGYTGSLPVTFETSGRVLGPGTATPYSSITGTYQYVAPATPTPTPTSATTPTTTPGPTATPGPGPTATPAPTTPPPLPLTIETIDVRTISARDATIAVATSDNTTATIAYGTTMQNFSLRVRDLTSTPFHLMILPDLTPDTTYYFRVTVTDALGRSVTSDLFIFKSAKDSPVPKINLLSLIATSDKTLIFSPVLDGSGRQTATLVMPTNTLFEIQFALTDKSFIKSIRLFTRNNRVLGFSSIAEAAELNEQSVMLEVKPGVFAGRLRTQTPGSYDLYARVEDFNGNISEQFIGKIKDIRPFTVLSKNDREPVEDAKVTLFIYNMQSKLFERISAGNLPINNPSYTSPNGTLSVVLPQGRYRAEIESFMYEKQTIDFTIGANPGEEYPEVLLVPAPFSIIGTFRYFTSTFFDVVTATDEFLRTLGASGRFLELNALAILACFVILSVMALAARLRVSVLTLPWYLGHLLHHHAERRDVQTVFKGKVIDNDTDRPVVDADIFLIDSASGQIILHTTSNSRGKFAFPMLPVFSYQMEIAKATYHSGHFNIHEIEGKEQTFSLIQHSPLLNLKLRIMIFVESLLSMSFELLLLASFILSILLGMSFGFSKVLPFLILAIVNLLFWMAHLRHAAFYKEG